MNTIYEYLSNVNSFEKEMRQKYRGLITDYDISVRFKNSGIPEWYFRMADKFFYCMEKNDEIIKDLFLGVDQNFDFDKCFIEISKILTKDIKISHEIDLEWYLKSISPKREKEIRGLHKKLFNNPPLGELLKSFSDFNFSATYKEALGKKLNAIGEYTRLVNRAIPDESQGCRIHDIGWNWWQECLAIENTITLNWMLIRGVMDEAVGLYTHRTEPHYGPRPHSSYDNLFKKVSEVVINLRSGVTALDN